VFDNPKIEILWNTEVQEILADENGVKGIKVLNNKTNEVTERETNGLFMGIGHTPNTGFLAGQINLDDHGFIITEGKHPDTNIAGVYACGDVQDSYYRQAISAAGSGCEAAIRAERFLEENGHA
jgi:thioredoxin reductase (NADPH)